MLCYFLHLHNFRFLQNEKRYAKKENAILLYSEKPFKRAAIIFYFIATFSIFVKKSQQIA